MTKTARILDNLFGVVILTLLWSAIAFMVLTLGLIVYETVSGTLPSMHAPSMILLLPRPL